VRRKVKLPRLIQLGPLRSITILRWGIALWGCLSVSTFGADATGLSLLRSFAPELDGSGIRVAHPEGIEQADTTRWQPAPSIARPGTAFSYTSSNGTATTFPNSVGTASSHANSVASLFYGTASGFAPGVAAVDAFDADHFHPAIIQANTPIEARIVNQSFIFSTTSPAEQTTLNRAYDDYADRFNVLFFNGLGNGGIPYAPASSYNGIGVAAHGGASSVGPTIDNGRSKPDLTAPAGATSFSAPQVAGSAALLLQAALRGDGGDTNAADGRVLKALLLNGAVKPSNWSAPTNQPLDPRYGAGVLNVFNSWHQLRGGRIEAHETTTVATGAAHPPGSSSATASQPLGWSFASITNTPAQDTIHHHYLDLPAGPGFYGATVTLVWNIQSGATALNDLDLYLVNTADGSITGQSITFVNNVEHLHLSRVPPGRYDLQVLKNGGNPSSGRASDREKYALAFEFIAQPLAVTHTDGQLSLSWPVAPDGFTLEASFGLPPIWTAVTNVPTLASNRNVVSLVSSNAQQIYRLRRP
jgi:hypothetical protein